MFFVVHGRRLLLGLIHNPVTLNSFLLVLLSMLLFQSFDIEENPSKIGYHSHHCSEKRWLPVGIYIFFASLVLLYYIFFQLNLYVHLGLVCKYMF